MANSGPNSNGSQFFVTQKSTNYLNGDYSVFGYVIKGIDVVNIIQKGDTIKHIEIVRVGDDAVDFNAIEVFNDLK